MQRIPFRLHGVVRDVPDSQVPPEFWTWGRNAIPRDGQMVTPKGFTEVLGDPGERIVALANTIATGTSYWVFLSRSGLRCSDAAGTITDLTPGSWSATGANGWTINDAKLTRLNGYIVGFCGGNGPFHWDSNTSNNAYFATSDAGGSSWDYGTVNSLWVFRQHLFVGDVGGDEATIAWSDAVPPATTAGSTGIDFYPTASNQAGTADLSDLGRVQGGLPLNRSCMIYGRSGTYIADYVGGNFVFAFRALSYNTGSLSRHSFCDIGNAHAVMTQDDIVLNDGRDMVSIAEQSVRREIFSGLNEDIADETWLLFNREENEVWCCYPTGSGGTQQAAVFNLGTRRWGFRDIYNKLDDDSAMTTAAYGIVSDSSVNQLWSDYTSETWAATPSTVTWDASGFTDEKEKLVGALQTVRDFSGSDDGVLVQLDIGNTDQAGNTLNTELKRWGLDLGDPDTVKVVTGLHLNGEYETAVKMRVGGRMFENGARVWSDLVEVSPGVDQFASLTATGRLFDVEFYPRQLPCKVAGFTLEVADSTYRY